MLKKYMFSNSKLNRLNNRDFNIDQNNLDYDFPHNRAALFQSGKLCCVAAAQAATTQPPIHEKTTASEKTLHCFHGKRTLH